MSRYHVASLRDNGGAVAADVLGDVFRAPWQAVQLISLQRAEQLGPRTLSSSEVMLYVTAGSGTARLHSQSVQLRAGVALTLFKDELLDVIADDELEVFFVEMGMS